MKVEQYLYPEGIPEHTGRLDAGLVLVFGATARIKEPGLMQRIRSIYPNARILGCSTAGEIMGTRVYDDTLVITAVSFEATTLKGSLVRVSGIDESYDAGRMTALALNGEVLRHVFVLSEGLNINGTELVAGIKDHLTPGATITGGLSGDGDRFGETYAFLDDEPATNTVAAIGLFGALLKVGYGSFGGWDPFGPERLITRSKGNMLFELDGKSALALYKQYLGEHAAGLPATGLLFPLSLRVRDGSIPVVRTLLAVNEADQSMTFAGNMPEGAYARLMKANFERLIDGAVDAARTSSETLGTFNPELAILISCVGRKLILKQRVEEEVEGVSGILGAQAVYTGFYSYGEISPFSKGGKCELHNQTMTITALHEA
ncbi:MAG TPA: FIST N-terminal domain-containing protein [Deltaproteobacteria bacterium]|nr:FIST N-terminal domain-containing protein [Deltaproteobacteria bacterium]